MLVGLGAGGCPMFGERYRWTLRGEVSWTAACDLEAALQTIRTWRPDLVLVMYTLSNQADVYIEGAWRSIADPVGERAFDQAAESIIEVSAAVGARVYWSDVPPARGGNRTFDTAAGRVGAHNRLIDDLLRRYETVRRFPLRSMYEKLGDDSFIDGVHLTKTAARELSQTQTTYLLESK